MEDYWIWWMAAVVLVIAEILSGTFYLIAIAFGLVAAGLSAYMGWPWSVQAGIAALLCTLSLVAIYRLRQGQEINQGQANLAYDIGENVHISQWLDERHARVDYRGAEWDAELDDAASVDAARKTWHIKKVAGSRLIIE